MSKRECGTCSMCCKLMKVPDFEGKPDDHNWCKHCAPGKGCTIYADRPLECRQFTCLWLGDERFGEHWFPQKSKIVVAVHPSIRVEDSQASAIAFIVDPAYPRRWREEPWFSDIKKVAKAGLENGEWSTVVYVGELVIPIVQ